jgi:pimeloyl-ACP methyl ester carboxylesterase
MATFVLVHGSCHGGWCWKKLIPHLSRKGHDVYAPTLTGLGERSHFVSRCIGLDTHILDIIQVLEYENLSEVFLVGHSYGGAVIGGAADKIPQRIRHLVYLDAYIPQDNKSVFDLEPGLETIYTKRALKERGIEWLVASYKPEEFGVSDRIDIDWMNSRLSPMPWQTHNQPVRITNPDSKVLPKSYICCSEFGRSQFKAQNAELQLGWEYYELMKGHDAMITAPEELGQMLNKLGIMSFDRKNQEEL